VKRAKIQMRPAELVARVHWLATGREVTLEEAQGYFQEPHRLRSVLEAAAVVADAHKRSELAYLLTLYEGRRMP
jgi:hypothetical protein